VQGEGTAPEIANFCHTPYKPRDEKL